MSATGHVCILRRVRGDRSSRCWQVVASAIVAALALPALALGANTADLGVDQTDDPDPVTTGDLLVYSIQVTNAGPDSVAAARVIDKLPIRVDFVSANSPGGSCGRKARVVRCPVGALASGASRTVVVRVRPNHAGQIHNVVSVETGAQDPKPANDRESEATTVVEPTPPITCAGRTATIVGTDGADVITGTSGPDVIATFGGDDSIRSLGGKDVVCGSAGNDFIRGGGRGDLLRGGGGEDEIRGGTKSDFLFGKGGSDLLRGGGGGDALRGGGGSDRCRGGGGDDSTRSC